MTSRTLPEDTSPARPRVLVVEDNVVNQYVALGMLEVLGYQADVAGNGLEALDALARCSYGVILMDCQMPEMDGFAATAEIRARERNGTEHLPVVAITAAAMAGEREKCLAAGMDDYVAKPIQLADLRSVLERWVGD